MLARHPTARRSPAETWSPRSATGSSRSSLREDPMVTLGVSVLVLQTAVFVGIAVSMFWYERSLLSPGGVVVPGYVALFLLLRPEVVAYTLAIALTTAALMRYASRFTILFGRRRFAVTMLAAMSLSIAIELIVGPFTGLDPGFQVIGFIIPGLIANEVLRQKIIPTLSTLGIVSAITAGITILLVGLWWVDVVGPSSALGSVDGDPRGPLPPPDRVLRARSRGDLADGTSADRADHVSHVRLPRLGAAKPLSRPSLPLDRDDDRIELGDDPRAREPQSVRRRA